MSNSVGVPIALNGTYFISDDLYIKGTLTAHFINWNWSFASDDIKYNSECKMDFNGNTVLYKNQWKALSFMVSFGYMWNN